MRTLAMTIALSLFTTGSVLASAKPEIRDHAQLFDAKTAAQVSQVIEEIQKQFKKDLTIETFSVIPESMQPSFYAQNKEDFYENWLRREAVAAGTNGVFILIIKDPGHIQIGVGARTSPKIFTNADRDALRDLMLKPLHKHQFDEAILEGANFVLDRMRKNEPGMTPPSDGIPPATPVVSSTLPTQPTSLPSQPTKPNPELAPPAPGAPTTAPANSETNPAADNELTPPTRVELNK